jgi:hypothetical protein
MSTDTQCSICLTDLEKNIKKLKCEHSFHENCINKWINTSINTCPLCRDTISLSKITFLPINNRPIIIPPHNNVVNYTQINNKFKKHIAIMFYILTIFFFIGSLLSHCVSIYRTNDYINSNIRFYNQTELNNHNSTTYSGAVLILLDVIFIIMYIITNILILYSSRNPCVYVFHVIICIANGIIHSQFQANTMKYLNDDVLDIYNKKYYDYCVLSVVLYGSSFATNIFIMMFVRLYMMEFERN